MDSSNETARANESRSHNLKSLLEEVEVALANIRADIAKSESTSSETDDTTSGLRVAEQALLRSMDWLRYSTSNTVEYSR